MIDAAIDDNPVEIQRKIRETKKALKKLENKLTAVEERSVRPGDVVTFKFGRSSRGGGVRLMHGKVIGLKYQGRPGWYVALITGEGFESEIVRVRLGDIKGKHEIS